MSRVNSKQFDEDADLSDEEAAVEVAFVKTGPVSGASSGSDPDIMLEIRKILEPLTSMVEPGSSGKSTDKPASTASKGASGRGAKSTASAASAPRPTGKAASAASSGQGSNSKQAAASNSSKVGTSGFRNPAQDAIDMLTRTLTSSAPGEDVSRALASAVAAFRSVLDAPAEPGVGWEDLNRKLVFDLYAQLPDLPFDAATKITKLRASNRDKLVALIRKQIAAVPAAKRNNRVEQLTAAGGPAMFYIETLRLRGVLFRRPSSTVLVLED